MVTENVLPRVSPFREEKDHLNLDAMIVVPAYDEGLKIIDTIYTAVLQQTTKHDKNVKHGVTVVLNNKPTASKEAKASNFQTYVLLQALEHSFPLRISGDEAFNSKVKKIQDSKVPIHVIDAFSEEHSSPQNNVGLARKIGTEYALNKLKDGGFVISTDADTRLHQLVVLSTKLMFETSDYSAIQYKMTRNLADTSIEEKRANAANSLYWDLTSLSLGGDEIEDSIVWMCGGSSAFTKKAYQSIDGYREIAGEEDTYIGIDMADKGLKIIDAEGKDPALYVSTRARFSERAATGLGRSILKWSKSKGAFHDLKISSFQNLIHKSDFLRDVVLIFKENFAKWLEDNKHLQGAEIVPNIFSNFNIDNPLVEAFLNDHNEKALRELSFMKLLTEYNLISAINPTVPNDIRELLDILSNYRTNQVNNTPHHLLYRKVNLLFQTKYPEQSVLDFVNEAEAIFLKKHNIMESNQLYAGFEEDQYKSPRSYLDFKDLVMQELQQTGMSIIDPEISTKIRISILSNYKSYESDLITVVLGFFYQKEVQEIISNVVNNEDTAILPGGYFPREIVFLRIRGSLLRAKLDAVVHIKNSMVYENNKETDKKLEKLILKLYQEYNKFCEEKLKPRVDDFRKSAISTIEVLKNELTKEEAKEKAEKEKVL